jgi:predicted Zn-dependent protease
MAARPIALLLLGALALCASAHADTSYYLVESLASDSTDPGTRAQARELERIYDDLARASGVDATLVYSDDPDINAFATEDGDRRIVVVQEGLLQKLGNDRDAVAATLGHELAHHKADHIRAGRRQQQGVRVLGAILGAVVGAKVGRNSGDLAGAVSGAAVGVGASLLALKFNRHQELEADRLSIGWMIESGYNPRGMLRLQQQLGAMPGKQRAAILSTHPASAKRYQAAEKFIAGLSPPPPLLARGVTPLVDAQQLTQARLQIRSDEESRMTRQAASTGDSSSAAALSSEHATPQASNGAKAAGVHIGSNVKIGDNVRIGTGRSGSASSTPTERDE